MSHSSQGKPDIQFSRFIGAAVASINTIEISEFSAKLMDVEKRDEIWGKFLRGLPVPFGEAYGGAMPHEYEVNMLGRHIILST